MLPTPATRRWSIRAFFTGARVCPSARPRSRGPIPGFERLGAETLFLTLPLRAPEETEAPQPASVVVEQSATVVQLEARGDVPVLLRIREAAAEREPPAHAELHLQDGIVVELKEQVLGPPADACDSPALQPAAKRCGVMRGEDDVCLVNDDSVDDPAGELRLQVSAYRLDLRQLRHSSSAVGGRVR